MTTYLNIPGDPETIEIHTSGPSLNVHWCSNWARIDELVTAGVLQRTHHGAATYGHCTYKLA